MSMDEVEEEAATREEDVGSGTRWASMMSRTCHKCHGVGHNAKYCVK